MNDLALPIILFSIAAGMPVVIVAQLLIARYLRMLRQWKWEHRERIEWPSPWTNPNGGKR